MPTVKPLPRLQVSDLAVKAWADDIVRILAQFMTEHNALADQTTPKRFFKATKPDASRMAGTVIYIKDENVGQKWQASNGTTWDILG